jgi:phenylalanyl-tRNA synthetase beta chain
MKVTYNWLKDFVDIRIPARLLADRLTMAGLEVTSLEGRDGDFVFEIEVTSNRPDCLSVMGIAREVAAITKSKIKKSLPAGRQEKSKLQSKIQNLKKENRALKIEIENKKDCPLYTAKIIRDIKVGPSPDWLKKRLELVGCRCVNNIVDITNYILFEYGEPLHAFDLDKLNNDTIIVRRAKNNERIVTIDGEERMLNCEILVIADKEKAVALAGVMGGRDTEVRQATRNILLEAAVFNSVIIRRARQALGLQSESSYRFERGIYPEIVEKASWQAVKLIQELAAGKCVLAKSSGITKTNKKSINLSISTVQKILGVQITPAKIKQILTSLDFRVNPVRNTKAITGKHKISNGVKTKTKNNFTVEIPAHRPDVNLEIDLIEEIARIFGYEFIPNTLPALRPQLSGGDTRGLVSLIKNTLVGLGLNEVITYSLINQDLLKGFGIAQEALEILNPLSQEQGVLRPTLLPSLLASIAYNLNQKQEYINIFEIASTFLNPPKEELSLGIALCGVRSLLLKQGHIKDEVGFLHLKGIIETVFERLGIKNYAFNKADQPDTISIHLNQEKIGLIQRLQRGVEVFAAELNLEKIFSYVQLKKEFVPLPKYPGIIRDISFILKEDICLKEALDTLQEKGRPYLSQIRIIDYYKGKQIPAGYRGLTVSCLYLCKERTLTEAEINPLHNLICRLLTEQFGAKIR